MQRHLILAVCLMSSLPIACGDDDDSDGAVSEESGGSGGTTGAAGRAGSSATAGSGGRAAGGSGGAAGRATAGSGGRAGSGTGGTAAGAGGRGGAGGTTAAGGSGGAAAGSGGAATGDLKDIVDTAVAAGSFTKLADALTKANLVEALKGDGPFTVFAPTDAAFDALPDGTLEALSDAELASTLKYHVVSGTAIKSTDLKNGQLAKSLEGPVLAVEIAGSTVKINGATVTMADIQASNGVIHVIDKVILPPGDIIQVATAAGTFGKLAAALQSADLVNALKGDGPFTVFAPTDTAFDKLGTAPTGDALKTVLQYHVISGIVGPTDLKEGGAAKTLASSPVLFKLEGGAAINNAKITTTNVVAKNGVIHVIDTVIVPPTDDIVATAIAAGSFTKLADALTSAELVDDLQAAGPFTVFAPTDAAFNALTATPTGDALKNVLLYHVVNGAVGSGDLKAGGVETLLTGKNLTIDLASGVKVNDATVTMANILTKNGIIHVVDKVLVPN